jgi:hypothetical protein
LCKYIAQIDSSYPLFPKDQELSQKGFYIHDTVKEGKALVKHGIVVVSDHKLFLTENEVFGENII